MITLATQSLGTTPLELATRIPEQLDPKKPRTFLSFFRKNQELAERKQKMGQIVRDMASYLACSQGSDDTVAKISKIGRSLSRKREPLSDADQALLERVRLAALLREKHEELAKVGSNLTIYFKTKTNRDYFTKWKQTGFPEEAFFFNPTVPSFIFKTHIHHKMRQYGGSFTTEAGLPWQYNEKTHEFSILQDGVFKNAADISEAFEISETKRLGSVIPSLVDKKTGKKWDFLPEKGLTQWDEAGWTELKPFARLKPEQVLFAQQNARRTSGEPGAKEDYVVEIVSTKVPYVERPFISGYQETFKSFRHPWIRIITPTGEFYSVGFNLGQNLNLSQPAATVKGIFRNPDPCETIQFSQRLITGFAVNKETCDDIIALCVAEQTKEITSFSFLEKNCTAFIDKVVEILRDKTQEKRSFGVDVAELFKRCIPKTLQKIGKKLQPAWKAVSCWGKNFCPPIVIKIGRAISTCFRLLGERILVGLSGKWLTHRRLEGFPEEEGSDPHKGIPWYKVVTHFNIALERKLVRVYLPRKVGEWQEDLVEPKKPGPGKTRVMEDSMPLFQQYAAQVHAKTS